jgi:hypothetical protein
MASSLFVFCQVELYEKYSRRLENAEREWQAANPDASKAKQNSEDFEEKRYERRLDAGLFPLQLCGLILALISSAQSKTILDRVMQLLHQQDNSLKDVKNTLQEFEANVGDKKSGETSMKSVLGNVVKMIEAIIEEQK